MQVPLNQLKMALKNSSFNNNYSISNPKSVNTYKNRCLNCFLTKITICGEWINN